MSTFLQHVAARIVARKGGRKRQACQQHSWYFQSSCSLLGVTLSHPTDRTHRKAVAVCGYHHSHMISHWSIEIRLGSRVVRQRRHSVCLRHRRLSMMDVPLFHQFCRTLREYCTTFKPGKKSDRRQNELQKHLPYSASATTHAAGIGQGHDVSD
jgi:hypothetical protein